jgi:uroporphyrin-III C-methyltransferase/precorrin-2 dehydrogenase/sirohydrochlorin ferrochelatase
MASSVAIVTGQSAGGRKVNWRGLPQHVAEAGLRPPAVIVVGEVVRFRDRIRWFDRDPEAPSPTILPTSPREGQPS